MAGTSLSTLANYKDGYGTHEHTYFGNGNGTGYLTTVGTGYQTTTYDGETQKIGTYYNFQAATIGTGAELTVDGSHAPDTFCPTGWQLPIDGTGSINKSFQKLFNNYSITSNSTDTNKARSYPLSYLLSGGYYWSRGEIGVLNNFGYWWSKTAYGYDDDDELEFYGYFITNDAIYSDANYAMNGQALRCVST